MSDTPITARSIALRVLNKFKPEKHDAAGILSGMINKTDQKGQATDLVFGTIRNRALIDHILATVADTPVKRINKRLVNIIRIGVYELVFASQTAEYAIVNEAANLTSEIAGKKQTGFVNAVLRNIGRGIKERCVPLESCDPLKTVPTSSDEGCLFKDNILPDPKMDPSTYYSLAFSIPQWLIDSWLDHYGVEKIRHICFGSNRRPSVCLQANTLKTSPQELYDMLLAEEIDCKLFDDNTIKLSSQGSVNKLPGFADGLFTIQDPTAAKVARLLSPKPGQVVVDVCAAPGGKTVALAQQMNDTGTIIASDIHDQRLKMVMQNCTRLGITAVKTVLYKEFDDCLANTPRIDAVLLDVPCSNSGVLARRLEVRMRITPEIIEEIAKTQSELLEKAATMLNSGGKICYSTCSICARENEEVVTNFLQNNSQFTLELEELTLPTAMPQTGPTPVTNVDCDGGYAAIIVKK
jgi:16S rRNA (cytosine967-C5)-methyltransferase